MNKPDIVSNYAVSKNHLISTGAKYRLQSLVENRTANKHTL